MLNLIYVSGTRADFGLMRNALKLLHDSENINLSICVTAMHLYQEYGNTVADIEQSGFPICERISVTLDQSSASMMSKTVGSQVNKMTDCFVREKPDMVILLGDRGEMLAAVIAAMHLNIPTLHLHGGEVSGHIDDRVRHAISVMSDYHCPATETSKKRLVKMGISEDKILVTGAPGLDELNSHSYPTRLEHAQHYNFDSEKPFALMQFHPVHDEFDDMTRQATEIMRAALNKNLQLMCMLPNADAGGHFICDEINKYKNHPNIRIQSHLARKDYLSFLAVSDLMIGNSSAGIIESASFGLPVINVGNRQNNRERNANVIDVQPNAPEIEEAIEKALQGPSPEKINLYGDGRAGERLLSFITSIFNEKEKKCVA